MADAVTINFENQENGFKGSVVHHSSSKNSTFDQVKSMARLVFAIQTSADSTPIGTYREHGKPWKLIQATDIITALRNAVRIMPHRFPQPPVRGRGKPKIERIRSLQDQKIGPMVQRHILVLHSEQHCRTHHRHSPENGVHAPFPSVGRVKNKVLCGLSGFPSSASSKILPFLFFMLYTKTTYKTQSS